MIEPMHPPKVERGGRTYLLTLGHHKNNCVFNNMDKILSKIDETNPKEVSGPDITGTIAVTYYEETIHQYPGGEEALMTRLRCILAIDYKWEIRKRQDNAMNKENTP